MSHRQQTVIEAAEGQGAVLQNDGESWTVGSSSSCDVVVRESTVSAEHCLITRTDSAYLVADNRSTNGTYVNGTKIDAPREVTTTDVITLGRKTRLDWSLISGVKTHVTRIGRAEDNDIVFSAPTVSAHHARIVVDGSTIVIEDLGSSNGTAIGSTENRIVKAPVHPSDTVYFGTFAVPAAQLLRGIEGLPRTQEPTLRPSPIPRPAKATSWPLWVAMAAVVLIAAIYPISRMFDSESPDARASITAPDVTTQLGSDDDGPNARAVPNENGPTNTSRVSSNIATRNIADSVYCLVACDAEQVICNRIGTCWAASQQHVVTTASVAKVYAGIESDFPKLIAFALGGQGQLARIRSVKIHPTYESWYSKFSDLTRQQRALRERLDSADGSVNVDLITQQVVQLEAERLAVMDQMATFDLAVLTVAESLGQWLPVSDIRRTDEVRLHGAPIGLSDPSDRFFSTSAGVSMSTLSGRVDGAVWLEERRGAPGRLLVRTETHHAHSDWRGSPVVCEDRVIGTYARPAFSDDGKGVVDGVCDVVSSERIHEMGLQLSK